MSECGYGCVSDIVGMAWVQGCPVHSPQAHAMSHPAAQDEGVQHVGEIAEMTKRARDRDAETDAKMETARPVAPSRAMQPAQPMATGVAPRALTFLPDYDARLGRGNAAMDAT